jgi:hypothetical protein
MTSNSDLLFIDSLVGNIGGGIGLIGYERYKLIKSRYESMSAGDENEATTIEKIKNGIEKIIAYIDNKPLYTFIYDYFEDNLDDFEIKESETKINAYDNNFLIRYKEISESLDSDVLESVNNAIRLTSREFLRNKLKFPENDIIDLKGEEKVDVVEPIVEDVIVEQIKKVETVKTVEQSKPKNNKNSIFLKTTKEKVNKELEEELFQEVLNNTKSMKNYAQSISDILKNDNKTLSKIEKIQYKEQAKTQKEVSSLKDYNNTLQIGFWKTVYMFLIVVVTFIFTLLITRIFPKLDKL